MKPRVLVVDDDRSMCELLEADLGGRGYAVTWCDSAGGALEALHTVDCQVVLTDLKMPDMNGLELCERIVGSRPDLPVVVMTAFGNMDTAVAAIRVGAYDFVTKPVDCDMLAIVLDRAARHHDLQEKVKLLSQAEERSSAPGQMIGESPSMQKLFALISRVADTESSILVTGESGTGKDLVARALHEQSRRASGPYVAINCSALPEQLLESELFGHKRGAFTDAKTDRRGLFLQAGGGTLFLDEVSEMPLPLQPKLLRALEERKIRPVGSDSEMEVDVRIVAATNRDLESRVAEQRFREDLFYRLNVIQITVPGLRSRGMDVLLLAQHVLDTYSSRTGKTVSGFLEAAVAKMVAYSWPGNVRELRNVVERAVALTRYEKITVEDLPERIRDYRSSDLLISGADPDQLLPMEEIERRYVLHVLESVAGNRTRAASVLGWDRKTLYRKLQRYESAQADDSGTGSASSPDAAPAD
jgi:two-component system response regulator HydG